MKIVDYRFTLRIVALVAATGLVAGCATSDPQAIDYRSSTKSKAPVLATPPNMADEAPDQRSLPPVGGETSLSSFKQVQQTATPPDTVLPPVPGMHIERDGTQRWLVIENQSPEELWPEIRRFWQEQGFLLVVDARERGIMETDWNETRPQISQDLIRNTLSKALSNSYVAGERNRYRTRLETAPNGGTYVFISQKGMHEVLTGQDNSGTKWTDKANEPGLEAEYLKRLMAVLALDNARSAQPEGTSASALAPAVASTGRQAREERMRSGMTAPARATTMEINLAEPYDSAWTQVGAALDRSNFTVDQRDPTHGLYYVRYVDPTDLSSAKQGFWNQIFHGKKEKVAKQYKVNVRALTESQTRVAIIDDQGQVEDSPQARQIMSLLAGQLGN
jgi:outer membrane protein assembly factor BamC